MGLAISLAEAVSLTHIQSRRGQQCCQAEGKVCPLTSGWPRQGEFGVEHLSLRPTVNAIRHIQIHISSTPTSKHCGMGVVIRGRSSTF